MEFVYLGLILAALYLLGLAGYKVWLSVRALSAQIQSATSKIEAFRPEESELIPATPSSSNDLMRLLTQRREMQKRKARAHEERQRRLVARISSINIDRR